MTGDNAPGAVMATCADPSADWRAVVLRAGSTRACTRLLKDDRCKLPKKPGPLRTRYEWRWRVEVVSIDSLPTEARRTIYAHAPFAGVLAGVEFCGATRDTLVWQLVVAGVPQLALIAGMPVSARRLQSSIDCSAAHPTRRPLPAGSVVSFELEGRCSRVIFAFRAVRVRG